MRFSFGRPAPANTPELPPAVPVDAARWQTLLQATDDAVLIADRDGGILRSNPVADLLFSTNAQTAADTLLSRTVSSELNALYRDAVSRQTSVEADLTLAQPLPRTLHVRVTPISDKEYLLVLRDLTELRRLESIRRDFVANVSHELRTPLTSIKAMAETLLDGALEDETVSERFLETIIRESDRLVRLSTDLLDLSRVEERGIQKTPVDLPALVADVVTRLASQAQKAGLTLTNSIRPPLIVAADRDEMAQVLVNLLDNAIAYTPRGGTVTLTAQVSPTAVTVSVADTGIGILRDDIPRLFERFYRADKARSRASGGTGLGLSIVKHIVENHGGTVGVESEYNKGSVFTFALPK
ncbi:MAG: ATP-binding protein [Armatimonadota bacterium]|nr:ATP-binding protein [Armatimonadota bacterium]